MIDARKIEVSRMVVLRRLGALALASLGGFELVGPGGAAEAAQSGWNLSDEEWRKRLKPAVYAVLRKHDTEPPFSSPLDHEKREGTFACAGCALPLFSSKTKFDSGSGWPSFYKPLDGAIATSSDNSLYEPRTEVHCRRCVGHLGHVFPDGPPPTGLRYCMNGLALTFTPHEKA